MTITNCPSLILTHADDIKIKEDNRSDKRHIFIIYTNIFTYIRRIVLSII